MDKRPVAPTLRKVFNMANRTYRSSAQARPFSVWVLMAHISAFFSNIARSITGMFDSITEMFLSQANYKMQKKFNEEKNHKIRIQKENFVEDVLLEIEILTKPQNEETTEEDSIDWNGEYDGG